MRDTYSADSWVCGGIGVLSSQTRQKTFIDNKLTYENDQFSTYKSMIRLFLCRHLWSPVVITWQPWHTAW